MMNVARNTIRKSSQNFLKLASVATAQQVRCYDKKVLEHFNNPRNVGTLDAKSTKVGTGLVGAPACGDVMRSIKINTCLNS